MTKLDLEFVGLKDLEGCITVDGKYVKIKKNAGYLADGVDKTYPTQYYSEEAKVMYSITFDKSAEVMIFCMNEEEVPYFGEEADMWQKQMRKDKKAYIGSTTSYFAPNTVYKRYVEVTDEPVTIDFYTLDPEIAMNRQTKTQCTYFTVIKPE